MSKIAFKYLIWVFSKKNSEDFKYSLIMTFFELLCLNNNSKTEEHLKNMGERLDIIDKAQTTFNLLNDRVNDLGRYKWR